MENAYYSSRTGTSAQKRTKNPFTIKNLKKGNNKKVLTVAYDVPENWIYNLNFLIKFKHSVLLGEPDVVIKTNSEDLKAGRERQKIKLN